MNYNSYCYSEPTRIELLDPQSFRDVYELLRKESLPGQMDLRGNRCIVIEDISMVPLQWLKFHPRTRKFIVIRNRKDIEAVDYITRNTDVSIFGVDDFFLVDPMLVLKPNEYWVIKKQLHAFELFAESIVVENPHYLYWKSKPRSDFSYNEKFEDDFNIIRYMSSEKFPVFSRLVKGDFLLEEDIDLSATTIVCDVNQCSDTPQILDEFRSAFIFLESNSSIYEMTSRLCNKLKRNVFVNGIVNYSLDNRSRSLVRVILS